MQELLVQKNELLNFNVISIGIEEDYKLAHWGRGRRTFLVLQYVLLGKGYFNGKEVRAGQGFVVEPGEINEYHSSEDEPWTYFFISLSGENVTEVVKRYLGQTENGIFNYDFKAKLMDIVTETIRSNFSGRGNGKAFISSSFALSCFWRIMSYHEENLDNDINHYVRDAKNYMRLHFHQALSISEIAKALNISDRYLYNLFIKHLGASPKRYLNGIRVARAEKYLLSTEASITEIAVSVGVPDVLAFSRFFKRYTGVSPTEYRKRRKNQ
ncbi:MAG: AraC family transcriptional regulator [Clostridia bacterium]|nr:AraC family transcriptional regulator [Clostridia bacterium]